MTMSWKKTMVLSAAVAMLVVGQSFAQQPQPRPGGLREQAKPASQQKVCLASKLTTMSVKDKANQAVGQIQDLVIDAEGQVKYLAISAQAAGRAPADRGEAQPGQPRPEPGRPAPGLPGATGKLTLVPFDAAEIHEGATEATSYVSLNIDKDQLMQAPSFTKQQLAASSQQAQWMSQVDQFFNRAGGAARPDLDRNKPEQKQNQELPKREE